jgi:hypothetical protein
MVKLLHRRKKEKYIPTEPLEIWLRLLSRVSFYSILLFLVLGTGITGVMGVLKLGKMPIAIEYFLEALLLIFLMTLVPAILWFWQGRRYSRNKLTESLFKNDQN